MIKVSRAESWRMCNICYSAEDVKNITFRYNGTNQGTQIALCDKCTADLVGQLLKDGEEE